MKRGFLASALIFNLALMAGGRTAWAQDVSPIDPPGFGLVTITPGEVIRLNVACFAHSVGELPPPCRGTLMFHDRLGNVLSEKTYDLQPGETDFLGLAPNFGDIASPRLGINPCVIPGPGGRAVPSVEVLDRRTRHVVRHLNPVAARMFATGEASPPDPERDPPGFGPVTINTDQVIRLNVVCFQHSIGGIPPPCRGEAMFHDAAGRELVHRAYDLQPGEAAFIQFAIAPTAVSMLVDIVPCLLPAAGGPAAPDVEVFDRATGNVALLVGPAVARVSELDQR
jgi:hypothetical protein